MIELLDTAWLDRTGIILNFVAGFLLAPELLGLDRIRRVEAFLERAAKWLMWRIYWVLGVGAEAFRWCLRPFGLDPRFLRLVSYAYRRRPEAVDFRVRDTILLLLWTGVSWTMLTMTSRFFLLRAPTYGKILFLILLAPLYLFGSIPMTLAVLLLLVLLPAQVAGLLLRGPERLRSILVMMGVVCFVIGNLLQLLATFAL